MSNQIKKDQLQEDYREMKKISKKKYSSKKKN